MPYIKQKRRTELNDYNYPPSTPGDLNYSFTYLIYEYVQTKNLSYQTINDIIGALEGAKLEFYRRIAIPYENTKLSENGDVYE